MKNVLSVKIVSLFLLIASAAMISPQAKSEEYAQYDNSVNVEAPATESADEEIYEEAEAAPSEEMGEDYSTTTTSDESEESDYSE